MILPNWRAPSQVKAFTVTKSDPVYLAPYPLRQVHQAGVILLPQEVNGRIEGDAVITRTPDVECAVETADCLPILVTNQQGNEVAAIHAGWRGLNAGVIQATFAQLNSQPQDCLVWLGPAICENCFEVGAEVREAFIANNLAFSAAFVKGARPAKWLGNLPKIATMILHDLGVKQIDYSKICTIEDLRCDSYRRENGSPRRMKTVISFKPS